MGAAVIPTGCQLGRRDRGAPGRVRPGMTTASGRNTVAYKFAQPNFSASDW